MEAEKSPEIQAMEEIEALEVRARDLKARLDNASNDEERSVLQKQLTEAEGRIDRLRQRIKRG